MAVYIDQNRTRAAHDGTTRGRNERTGCSNNFIAGPDPEGIESQFERDRSIGHTDGMLGVHVLGKLGLEQTAFLPSPIVHLSRAKHGSHSLDFIAREIRPR